MGTSWAAAMSKRTFLRPWWVLAASLACGGDVVITLGEPLPVPSFVDEGRGVLNLNGPAQDDRPTLTGDLLEIYFTSTRPEGRGSGDVWYATRSAREDAFGAPQLLGAASTSATEASAAVSPDGLTLWFASDRPGGLGELDVWQLQRASRDAEWSAAVNVAELNTASSELPRPVARGGLVMPLSSRRDDVGAYQTYLARRTDPSSAFDSIEPVSELWSSGSSMEDAFVTEDGLFMFFRRAEGEGDGDLFLAWRDADDEPFREAIALSAVNTASDEQGPWMSPEEDRFFFSSNRREGRGSDIVATNIELPRRDR